MTEIKLPCVLSGLINSSMTICYANSLIQVILHNVDFCLAILAFEEPEDFSDLAEKEKTDMKWNLRIVRELKNLLIELILSNKRNIDPTAFIQTFQ